jgi:hypothetical protein
MRHIVMSALDIGLRWDWSGVAAIALKVTMTVLKQLSQPWTGCEMHMLFSSKLLILLYISTYIQYKHAQKVSTLQIPKKSLLHPVNLLPADVHEIERLQLDTHVPRSPIVLSSLPLILFLLFLLPFLLLP